MEHNKNCILSVYFETLPSVVQSSHSPILQSLMPGPHTQLYCGYVGTTYTHLFPGKNSKAFKMVAS